MFNLTPNVFGVNRSHGISSHRRYRATERCPRVSLFLLDLYVDNDWLTGFKGADPIFQKYICVGLMSFAFVV